MSEDWFFFFGLAFWPNLLRILWRLPRMLPFWSSYGFFWLVWWVYRSKLYHESPFGPSWSRGVGPGSRAWEEGRKCCWGDFEQSVAVVSTTLYPIIYFLSFTPLTYQACLLKGCFFCNFWSILSARITISSAPSHICFIAPISVTLLHRTLMLLLFCDAFAIWSCS